ncbi:MAG: restriction endonuclease subunit S, partial [Candidatus Solibacter sp.]|nr:restriction endonuclease subunit S [Candidatus Solibacter sp.]
TLCRDNSTVPLRSLASVTGGGTPSKENSAFWQGRIPWVSPKDMKTREIYDAVDHISEEALLGSAAKLISAPAVLFVVRGMILAHTLPVAISRVDVAINQDMKALQPQRGVSPLFLGYMLRGAAPDLLNEVEVAGHGTRRLQTEKWINLPIPNLSPDEQASAVAELEEIERTADEATNLTAENSMQAFEGSVLRQAFAGEL